MNFLPLRATLLAWGDELAFGPRVVRPATGQGLAAGLLCKVLHAPLQFGPEVSDETLDRPCESLAKS